MFSDWFSGDECEQYRTSPHKQRIDQVGSSLLELRYANEVIRQYLHEWLRFSRYLEERSMILPATGADTVRQYVAQRTSGTPVAFWIRRRVQPSWPKAMTCFFFSSLKTLLI